MSALQKKLIYMIVLGYYYLFLYINKTFAISMFFVKKYYKKFGYCSLIR